MRPIRLLACDLDGTLIGPRDIGLDVARKVVLLCRERGVLFSVATGRVYGAAKPYLTYLDINAPAITNGGALLATKEGDILSEECIPKSTARVIWRKIRSMHLPSYFVIGKEMFTEWTGPETTAYSNTLGYGIKVVDSCLSLRGNGPTQMVVRCEPEKAEGLKEDFERLYSSLVSVQRTLPHLLEFLPKTASKACALEKLSRLLNVKKDEVMALGDSLNDLDMLSWAEKRACVANAHPKVLERVETVSKEPYAWGVMEILEKYFAGDSFLKRE